MPISKLPLKLLMLLLPQLLIKLLFLVPQLSLPHETLGKLGHAKVASRFLGRIVRRQPSEMQCLLRLSREILAGAGLKIRLRLELR